LEQTGEEEGAKVASFNQSEKEVEVLDLSLRGERERERERGANGQAGYCSEQSRCYKGWTTVSDTIPYRQ
jgi:hypothetical protein